LLFNGKLCKPQRDGGICGVSPFRGGGRFPNRHFGEACMALTDSEIERAKSREKSYSLRDSEERQAMALEVSVRWQRNWARRSFDALFKLNLIVEMLGVRLACWILQRPPLTLIREQRHRLHGICGFSLLSFLLGGYAQNQRARVSEPLLRLSSVHGGQQQVSGRTEKNCKMTMIQRPDLGTLKSFRKYTINNREESSSTGGGPHLTAPPMEPS
jgi:hypothetical protein